MFDVFYWGPKPNIVEFEKPAIDLADAARQSRTAHYWYIYGGNDYRGFDFDYTPPPWESNFTHVWESQHQRNGDVYLGCKSNPDAPKHYLPKIINRRVNHADIYYVDHGNGSIARHQFDVLKEFNPNIHKTRFVDNYLDTFKRIMNVATTEFVWIINSVCDYTTFDFTWHPDEFQREMIHCFPSGMQERGDTFYIHVESFKQQMIELELLDWFNVINYCDDQYVDRFDTPAYYYDSDDLVTEVKNYKFETPYVLFTNQKDMRFSPSPCLWTEKDRVVERCSRSGATALIPRDIKRHLKRQIYDYPYLETSVYQVNEYHKDRDFSGLDIVYISNGEPDEERWYEHLCYMSNTDAKWVRGVNGRTAAYQEAARRSDTLWFFAVFAKLEVLGSEFPWFDWQPDYFQEPKHYIFNSRNPVNGLEYGHQGIIAYNKKLVLENNTPGIDFTLSQPHESVPILSGIAHFNQTPWMTWRTAFREVVKLKHFMATEPTVETSHRLATWCEVAEGDFAEYCLAGAHDAVLYYNQVGGDYDKLKLSFEWAWLKGYWDWKYYPS
jgi:hypothetical protein